MVECHEDTALTPGTWYLWKTGKQKVFFACPVCGGIAAIAVDDVDEDGKFVRGFWCRTRGCFFHEEIKLAGWRVVRP